ncbi:hypothetical protein AE0388_1207 [Brevibacterium linens]|uniref:Uncharacterized protein n=1 Tax=Brevibacterium linens TaxID=1703 RepID=A0A0B9AQX6_BRELN|nr:hypothetical protein AE0388_1207 [Brevibacterium linens]
MISSVGPFRVRGSTAVPIIGNDYDFVTTASAIIEAT